MQNVRFFEDKGGPNGMRRLLVGVASYEEPSWEVDGGRREAVKPATTVDAQAYPQAYQAYYESFSKDPAGGAQPASE